MRMRDILEDALITYRQEVASLLTLVAPAVLVGPFLVVLAASGLIMAVVIVPLLVLLYLATYAACVRAAGFVLRNLAPDPALSYLDVLSATPDLLRVAAPGGILLATVTACALVISDMAGPLLALQVGLLGFAAFLVWWARHAYDQPLILIHEVEAEEAAQVSAQLARGGLVWTLLLLGATILPLLVVALLSLGLAAAITPTFGGAVFTLAFALWLPVPALSVTSACTRLVGAS